MINLLFRKEKKPFFMPILILLRHPLRHIKRNNDPNNTDRKHDCNFTGEHPSNIGSDKSLRKGQLLHHFRLAGVQLEQLHFALRYKAHLRFYMRCFNFRKFLATPVTFSLLNNQIMLASTVANLVLA